MIELIASALVAAAALAFVLEPLFKAEGRKAGRAEGTSID
jgi:hypothetical protein